MCQTNVARYPQLAACAFQPNYSSLFNPHYSACPCTRRLHTTCVHVSDPPVNVPLPNEDHLFVQNVVLVSTIHMYPDFGDFEVHISLWTLILNMSGY